MIATGAPAVRYVQIGVDVGKMHDPTAIVVSDISRRATGQRKPGYHPGGEVAGQWIGPTYAPDALERFETRYTVRHMERIPLGVSYPEQARRLVRILANLAKLRLPGEPRLERSVYLDITGVGRPVFDIVAEELLTEPLASAVPIYGLTFTGGEMTTYDRDEGRLPKAYLVSRLQALMQGHCIELPPDHPDTPIMQGELKTYEIRLSQSGKDTYGAFANDTHDDYATGLGLSCLHDPYALMAGYGPAFWG